MTADSTGDATGNYTMVHNHQSGAGTKDMRTFGSHDDHQAFTPSPIAICSMAFRLPSGIKTDDKFWEVLSTGQDLRGPIPASRFNADGFDDSLGDAMALKAKHGYFLNEDLAALDASFFSMTEKEISSLDPQIRQLLELTRECLESAGEADYRGKRVGCYIGAFSDEWSASSRMDLQHYDTYSLSGAFDIFMANKVSYEFDFKGPSMVIKTGCSASGVALHEACRALQSGDCTSAIVGGVSLITGPYIYNELNALTALSSEGSCKTFDANADGFARGEAINVFYLKKLTDAIQDNNPIRAIIRNTGTNSDGKGGGTLAPNSVAQEALIRHVYDQVGLDPADTPFVECHGTGTATGDPIETTAIGKVFRDGAYIGSVKPNVGHSEAASALTSLIKAVLSLEHRTIPPNIKFNKPNPKIPFQEYGLVVPTKSICWPEDKQRRISINSFGLGGSNMHMIVEACPQSWSVSRDWQLNASPQLLLFSANSKTSLQKVTDDMLDYHSSHIERASDMAYTLACRRELLHTRSFAVVSSGKASTTPLVVKIPDTPPRIAMVFTGQGAQWPLMGSKLIESDPAFRRDMLMLDIILQQCRNPPPWSIVTELAKPPESSRMYEAEISQPLCTAIQIGLVNAFRRAGIEPAAVIGHSSGEIAAAYASRALSLKEAILVAYYRGFVSKTERQLGGMAAIGMDAETTSKFLSKGVVVAAENSPQSTTISGDLGALDETIANIKESRPGVVAKKLRVDMAYHSHQMIPIAKLYEELLHSEFGEFGQRNLQCSFYSTVTGKAFDGRFNLSYWAENMANTVKFSPAAQELLRAKAKNLIVMEVGPHSQLAGPLRQILTHVKAKFEYIATLLRDENCTESILTTFGKLFQHGVKVNFSAMIRSGSILSDLPAYPWDHSKHYWKESLLSKAFKNRQFPHHSLLGLRVLTTTPIEPSWRNVLDIRDVTWVKDHKVYGRVIFPFACYIAMAGEAVRQLNGGSMAGYTVTHVGVQTPLIFDDGQLVEIITTLRRQRLTDSLDSDAFEFAITSSTSADKDSQWKKHCYGTIKACTTHPSVVSDHKVTSYPREVSSRRWYDAFERKGYNFGPEFRTLSNMRFDTTSDRAVAEVINPDSRKGFMMDPTVIDACLQLVVASSTRGLTYRLDETVVPTVVEEMSIFNCDAKSVSVEAWVLDKKANNGMNGVANGQTVIQLKGLTLSPIPSEIEKSEEAEKLGAARLEWTPDFDFLDYSQIIDPPFIKSEVRSLLKELVELCILESHDRICDLSESASEHLNLYREWMDLQVIAGSYQETISDRSARIQEIFCQIRDVEPSNFLYKAVRLILDNVEDIFVGNISPLELLTRDGLLVDLYTSFTFRLSRFVKHLSDSKPRLRILEIGAGTGGGTNLILRDLVVDGANPPYEQYTFTDISSGFFGKAAERFSYAPNMEYKTFDISLSPAAQGFEDELGTYDLVVGFFVVHATPNLKDTLQNIRQLLRPDGHLVICETSPHPNIFSYIFGTLSGWWLGEQDGRKWDPSVDTERWDRELKASGYSGVDSVVMDVDGPDALVSAIVSRPAQAITQVPMELNEVTIMCLNPKNGIPGRLYDELKLQDIQASFITLGDTPTAYQPIISTIALEVQSLDVETYLGQLQTFFSAQNLTTALWLLPPSQIGCEDPHTAELLGLIKGVTAEMSLPNFTLQIQPSETGFGQLVGKVLQKVITNVGPGEVVGEDKHFLVKNGTIMISRYQPFLLEEAQQASTVSGGKKSSKNSSRWLQATSPGALSSLAWIEGEIPGGANGLAADEVEVDVRAIGLNFRDVLFALGIIKTESTGLGFEGAGVIRKVGANVAGLSVGDRVAFVTNDCTWTRMRLSASVCASIPENWSFEQAATIPITFMTVMHALVDVAQLTPGQTVLVHSACGGVGHAAIQLCQLLGAEVFVTVGNEDKVRYAVEKLKIPRNRIFSSRDDSFVAGIMRETNGQGVDVVLNSLSGNLLHASWKCVGEFGKMIELGKRDAQGFAKLSMETFLSCRTYSSIDVLQLLSKRPKLGITLFRRVMQLCSSSKIKPIPHQTFSASEVEIGFRTLQRGAHIGKLVLSIPQNSSDFEAVAARHETRFDPKGSYILTGGLGGLGKSMATWMAERGARDFVLLSPSAASPSHSAYIQELESMGCKVHPVSGKVEEIGDVKTALAAAGGPVKGVVHLAMKLKDMSFQAMLPSDWSTVMGPKADGAINLHNLLLEAGQNLDFFILTSSMAGVMETPGQANYHASNSFLESFAQHRRSMGLPASVIVLPAIGDVGYVAADERLKRYFAPQNAILYEKDLLKYFEHAVRNQLPHNHNDERRRFFGTCRDDGVVYMGLLSPSSLSDPKCQTAWRYDPRMGSYHNAKDKTQSQTTCGSLKSRMAKILSDVQVNPPMLKESGTVMQLATLIGSHLFSLMMREETAVENFLEQPFRQMGLDSMVLLELRGWWAEAIGIPISPVELAGKTNLRELGECAAEKLYKRFSFSSV